MPKLIISYRRADTAGIVGRIFDRLSDRYGEHSVFLDVDKIPVGVDFRDHIRENLKTADCLIAAAPAVRGDAGLPATHASAPIEMVDATSK